MIRRIVISLFICLAASRPAGAELLPVPGDWEAPLLSLPDLGGTQHSLDAYRGKVVLVNFWASWCAPCLIEMPGMQRLETAMKDRPFAILAVNVKETKAKVWRFKKLLNVSFPTLLDSDGTATETWEVEFYPTSFLVDGEGNIRYTAYGAIDWDGNETHHLIEALMRDRRADIDEASNHPGKP